MYSNLGKQATINKLTDSIPTPGASKAAAKVASIAIMGAVAVVNTVVHNQSNERQNRFSRAKATNKQFSNSDLPSPCRLRSEYIYNAQSLKESL